MPRIIPNLWFEHGEAEEAAAFYTGIFPGSEVRTVLRYGESGPGEPGTVMTVDFTLGGQPCTAINGGPHATFNDAISLFVDCHGQEEIDRYWDALLAGGGQPVQCGWLKDRYGVSWQVVDNDAMAEVLGDADPERRERAMAAMMQMVKIDVEALRAAADGVPAAG